MKIQTHSNHLNSLTHSLKILKSYLWLILIIYFAAIYAYLLLKIDTQVHAQPSSLTVSAQLKTTPHPAINPNIIKQLEQLQNNSVSVQALFNQSRQNPFQ